MSSSGQFNNPTLHQPLHSKVSNYLNNQRGSGQYCDLILELNETSDVSENIVLGHYCVVAAQSKFIGGSHFLQNALQFSINSPLRVTIEDFNCFQCLQTMMDFFYEDVITIATEHEQHFKHLAKMLGVTELLKLFDSKDNSIIATNDDTEPINDELEIISPNGAVSSIQHNVNVVLDNIFDEQRNYFKLNNPRASASSKINYCTGCDFKCYRVKEMVSHMSSCEASHLSCCLCEVGFVSWREYESHLRKHSEDLQKPFFCLECGTRFMTRAALLVHHPKHSSETPHRCPHCGKGFKWKQGLSSHMLVHNKEKQMLCDVCGFKAIHMKSLKSHKLQHTGELFKCSFPNCNHRANRKENLQAHMDTHKQEHPFVCEVCGCKFSQNKNLKRHALKHAAENTNKFKCQLCPFNSHRSDKVKEHMQRVHTEKAIQLELPEIVENAFESQNEDEFNLPLLLDPIDNPSKAASAKTKFKTKQAKPNRSQTPLKTLVPRLPKIIAPKLNLNYK